MPSESSLCNTLEPSEGRGARRGAMLLQQRGWLLAPGKRHGAPRSSCVFHPRFPRCSRKEPFCYRYLCTIHTSLNFSFVATRGRTVDRLARWSDQNADRRRAPISVFRQWVSHQLQPAPDKHLSAHPAVQFRLLSYFRIPHCLTLAVAYCYPYGLS